MAKKGTLEIKAIGDASSVSKMVGEVNGKLGSLSGMVTKAAGAFAGLYAAKKVIGFLEGATSAAMEDQKAIELLHTSVRNITGATDAQLQTLDKYVDTMQNATGVEDNELRQAMIKLTGATKNTTKAQEYLNVALDVSAARGVELDSIVQALEKAENGSVTALQRLGIETKNAAGETKSLDEILQDLNRTYGGSAAAFADTFAGKLEILKLRLGDAKEKIGYALMPALEKFIDFLGDHMSDIEDLAKLVGENLAVAIDGLADIWTAAWPLIQKALSAAKPIIKAALWVIEKAVWLVVKAVEGLEDAWNWLAGQSWKNDLKELRAGITETQQSMVDLYNEVQEKGFAVQYIEDDTVAFAQAADDAAVAVDRLGRAIPDDEMAAFHDSVTKAYEAMMDKADDAADSIQGVLDKQREQAAAWLNYKDNAVKFIETWKDIYDPEVLREAISDPNRLAIMMGGTEADVAQWLNNIAGFMQNNDAVLNTAINNALSTDARKAAVATAKSFTGETARQLALMNATLNIKVNPVFDWSKLPAGLSTYRFAGGGVMPYTGFAQLHEGERVLSPEQTSVFERMVSALERVGGSGSTYNMYTDQATMNAYSRQRSHALMGMG